MTTDTHFTGPEMSRRQVVYRMLGGAAALAGVEQLPSLLPQTTHAAGDRPLVLCWVHSGEPASLASLRQHASTITHLSPTWYKMEPDLSLAGTPDQMVIDFSTRHGLSLHPAIGNTLTAASAQPILGTPQARARAAQTIAELVLKHDFDGINLDFEGNFGTYRDQYSDLMDQLALHLRPAGKWVTVDVPPNHPPSSWSAAYDYARLGQACDAVVLMAYDYSVQKPGSVAPLWWVRRAVGSAQKQIPPNKLVVGLPFFGRHWTEADGRVSVTPLLTHTDALDLLAWSGGPLHRPTLDATPRFSWSDGGTTHIVHFEDMQSLAAKLRSLDSRIRGAAFWRLGLEDQQQWDALNSWVHRRLTG
jgi:spore germination protein YaaH